MWALLPHSLTLKPGKHGRRDTQTVRKLLDLNIRVLGTPQCIIIQDFHVTEAFVSGPQQTSTLCLSCHSLWIPTWALLRVLLGCEGCVRTGTAHTASTVPTCLQETSLLASRPALCPLAGSSMEVSNMGECFGAGASLEQVLHGDLTQTCMLTDTHQLPEYFRH